MSLLTRRGLLAALAGAALDPERALWVPGRKLISIPALPTLPTLQPMTLAADFIGQEMLRVLRDHLVLARALNAQYGELAEQLELAPRPPWIGGRR